jgi:hypothetical protein
MEELVRRQAENRLIDLVDEGRERLAEAAEMAAFAIDLDLRHAAFPLFSD